MSAVLLEKPPVRKVQSGNVSLEGASSCVIMTEIVGNRAMELQLDFSTHRFLHSLPKAFAWELARALHCSYIHTSEIYRGKKGTDGSIEVGAALEGKQAADERIIACLKQVIGINRYTDSFEELCNYINESRLFLRAFNQQNESCGHRLDSHFNKLTHSMLAFLG